MNDEHCNTLTDTERSASNSLYCLHSPARHVFLALIKVGVNRLARTKKDSPESEKSSMVQPNRISLNFWIT